ncbi:MAG: hypothetical protein GTO55_04990 [Armatimonadetes bacterium]|nr:hypothetical protein [Armatimonadota bacterium]NIM23622.1 hypothetical protein [Armatimonadota bacterium]NIM67489.1 hypothetical protein [Armatimonadota bacterium]NIM75985.1 hypothetical protein [Armatimonadota bacterium]NIN05674.1 hypothetical protein [Armatimonadota bacterium]
MRFKLCRADEGWLSAKHVKSEDVCQAASAVLERAQEITSARPTGETAAFPETKKRRRFSSLVSLGETKVFLKLYLFPRLRDRLLLHLGITKAGKAYAASLRLHGLGILCPHHIAILRSNNPLALVLASEALPEGTTLGRRIMESLREGQESSSSRDWQTLIDQLAAFVAGLHQQGIYHDDLHHSNLWVKAASGGKLEFYILDLEEISFCSTISRRRRLFNLLHLTRNLGAAAAGAELDGVALGLRWARAYQQAAGIELFAEDLVKVEAAARLGMKLWREDAAQANPLH